MRTTLEITWQPQPGEAIPAHFDIMHGGKYEKDFRIPPKAVDHIIPLISDPSERQAVLIVSGGPLTVKTNENTFEVTPKFPVIWFEATRCKCPITGQVTQLRVTNPADCVQLLKIRIAEREEPSAPVPATREEPMPAVPVLAVATP